MSDDTAGGTRGRTPSPRVKNAGDVERRPVAAGSRAWSQVLIGEEDGAPHFALRRFVMEEGGGMPRHVNDVEHEQYVLRGRARVGIGEAVHEVGPDDVLFIPAGIPHSYDVVEAPFEFLCVVPSAPDSIRILDSASGDDQIPESGSASTRAESPPASKNRSAKPWNRSPMHEIVSKTGSIPTKNAMRPTARAL